MRRRVFLQFAGAGIWNSAAAGGAVGGPLPVGAIRLAGHYGYRPQQLRDLPPGTVIDAREAKSDSCRRIPTPWCSATVPVSGSSAAASPGRCQ
jgi:hypothetical protein